MTWGNFLPRDLNGDSEFSNLYSHRMYRDVSDSNFPLLRLFANVSVRFSSERGKIIFTVPSSTQSKIEW